MVVFIDDILVYSNLDEEHVEHLRVLFQTLKENQLYVKLCKYEFLGHAISSGGITVDPSKMNVVLQWET